MILVDTSIWIDHLRHGEPSLVQLLESSRVLCHPFVVGELACGSLKHRALIVGALGDLPQAVQATHREALLFLERHALAGRGIGWVDLHLLASTVLTSGARLWTADKRLAGMAGELGLAHPADTP